MLRGMMREGRRDKAAVLPTMAPPTAPAAADNPELVRATRRDEMSAGDGNVMASPSATSGPGQVPATGKPQTVVVTTAIDKLLLQTALFEAPTDTPRARQWLMIVPVAACLLALGAGWWLRGELGNQVELIAPATRPSGELALVQQALQHERDKADKLARDLATAWRQLRTQAVELADNAAYKQELIDLRHALHRAEEQSAAHQKLLGQDRIRSRGLEEQPAVLGDARPARGRNATAALPAASAATPPPATSKAAKAAPPTSDKPVMPMHDRRATIAPPATPETSGIAETARLMARASLLLEQGNIGAARILFERAAETGSAPALFALAETYDPAILSAWGTFGTQGDVARAQELYARALAAGVQEAKDRLDTLRR